MFTYFAHLRLTHPQWVVDCILQNTLLPVSDYRLQGDVDRTHSSYKGFFQNAVKGEKQSIERSEKKEEQPGVLEMGDLVINRVSYLVKLKGKDTETVITALIKHAKKLPTELYKSLTWDRGSEMAGHQRFTLATNVDVYFCDPQSPWQRGSNENTNRLLRQYFPKGTDLSVHSQATLNKVARQLNERPRETLEFETPAERFNACVASTG